MKDSMLYYSVGALLYCPANHKSIVNSIAKERFGTNYSLALCLEDTISDDFIAEAEDCLVHSLAALYHLRQSSSFFMPKIFVRIRSKEQISMLLKRLGMASELLFGFIIPKFDLKNADDYIQTVSDINANSSKKFYVMPIMESPAIIDLRQRTDVLYELKDRLKAIEPLVLNIRVGGNDLCHAFGFRRQKDESIHDILPVSSIFSDIITAFGMDYVVSGPVWEYYNGEGWSEGLCQELKKDRLIGFVGKTVIHPKQISFVNQAYAVTKEDFKDAQAILNWKKDDSSFVSGSIQNQRMNEYKTHTNWARKIIFLSNVYGVLP